MEPIQEKRKLKRHLIRFPASMIQSGEGGERVIPVGIRNLTVGGMAVESPECLSVGTEVALTFPLQHEVSCAVTKARVIHGREEEPGRCVLGLAFSAFGPQGLESLERYLSVLKLLQSTNLFKKLTLDEVRRLLAIGREQFTPDGKLVFAETMSAQALFIVLSGAVKILKKNSRGVEEALAIIREGEVFGEMALLDDYPRTASAQAHRDSVLLRIDSADFKALMGEHGELANKLLWIFVHVLCKRLREADKQIVEMFSTGTAGLSAL